MLIKCICTNCAGHLEFEEENAGEEIECPHCGFDTRLFLPGTEPEAPQRLSQKLLKRRPLLITASAFIAGAAGFALYHWVLGALKRDWLPYTESKVLPVLALGVFCLIGLVLVVWLCLPLLFFLQLGKITRVLGQIEMNLRPTLPVYPPSEEVLVNEDVEEPSPVEELAPRSQTPARPASAAPRESV